MEIFHKRSVAIRCCEVMEGCGKQAKGIPNIVQVDYGNHIFIGSEVK